MPHIDDYDGIIVPQASSVMTPITMMMDDNTGSEWYSALQSHSTLHDREPYLQQLFAAYDHCLQQGPEKNIVLITGPSGVGKTALALKLQERVHHRDGGYFLTGKFDQLSSCSPCCQSTDSYAPFVEAITKYTNYLIMAQQQSGDDKRHAIRMALLEALDLSELRVLRGTIPALGKIIGNSTSSSRRKIALQGADAEVRFAHIFCKLIKTISSQGYPIVLLLDDVQWATERGSFVLLKALAKMEKDNTTTNNNNCQFLLMCTYRTITGDESVELSSPSNLPLQDVCQASELFTELRAEGVYQTNIELANLSEAAVENVVAEMLFLLDDASKKRLAKAIYDQTNGNAFYVLQLVQEVVESGENNNNGWHPSVIDGVPLLPPSCQQNSCSRHDTADNTMITRSITHHLRDKFQRLPDDVKMVLKVGACLGTTFSEDCLLEGAAISLSSFCVALHTIEDKGIIVFDPLLRTGRFQHDQFQQASYELILPENERDEFHLLVGRRLRVLVKSASDDHLLVAANQIRRGIHLINDAQERNELARFFLRAGETAALASSFSAAAQYLHCGIKLLNQQQQQWSNNNQYDLMLTLHNMAAEMEYYNGNLFRVDALVARIINNAKCFNDTLVARFTQIYSMGTRGEMDRAIDDGMSLLKALGEVFPCCRRGKVSRLRVVMELLKCKRMLMGKSESDILSLPPMRLKHQLTVMRLISIIYGFAYFTRKELMPLLASRLVQITLRHGISDMSAIGFAALGLVYSTLGFVEEAYRYSQLGIVLSEKHPSDEWQGYVSANIYGFVYPLKHKLRDCLGPLLAGHRAGLVAGDIHLSMICASIHCMFTLHAGYPLPVVVNELRTYRKLCMQYGQCTIQIYFDIMNQFCLNMMMANKSNNKNPLIFTGDVMNEEKVLAEIEKKKNPFAFAALLNSKHAVAVYLNDFESACVMANRLECVKNKLLPFALHIHNFLQGVASAALSRKSRYHRQQARRLISKLRKCAMHAPDNFLNKVFLVEAELASSLGNYKEAMMKYNLSIQLAQDQQCVREQAFACERAGYSLHESGERDEALQMLTQARLLYEQWGARIKVNQLDAVLMAIVATNHGNNQPLHYHQQQRQAQKEQ